MKIKVIILVIVLIILTSSVSSRLDFELLEYLIHSYLGFGTIRPLGTSPSGGVYYYDFEEGSGTTLIDRWSGNNATHDGSYVSGVPSFNGSGSAGSYAMCFSNSQEATSGANVITSLTGNHDRTICAWVNESGGTYRAPIIAWGTNDGSGGLYDWWIDDANTISIATSDGNRKWGTNSSYSDGTWHYYCLVQNGTSQDDINLWMDGIKQSIESTTDGTINSVQTTLKINYDGDSRQGDLCLDEVKIFNRTLTDTEIINLYNYNNISGAAGGDYFAPSLKDIQPENDSNVFVTSVMLNATAYGNNATHNIQFINFTAGVRVYDYGGDISGISYSAQPIINTSDVGEWGDEGSRPTYFMKHNSTHYWMFLESKGEAIKPFHSVISIMQTTDGETFTLLNRTDEEYILNGTQPYDINGARSAWIINFSDSGDGKMHMFYSGRDENDTLTINHATCSSDCWNYSAWSKDINNPILNNHAIFPSVVQNSSGNWYMYFFDATPNTLDYIVSDGGLDAVNWSTSETTALSNYREPYIQKRADGQWEMWCVDVGEPFSIHRYNTTKLGSAWSVDSNNPIFSGRDDGSWFDDNVNYPVWANLSGDIKMYMQAHDATPTVVAYANFTYNYTITDNEVVLCTNTSVANNTAAHCLWSGLNVGETYSFKVRANDSAGNSVTSGVYSFTVVNNAPTITLVSPADNATGVGLNAVINYTYTDAEGDAGSCTLYNNSDNNAVCTNNSVANGTTIHCNSGVGDYSTTFTYYVNCSDGTNMTKSTTWNFTTVDNSAPSTPSLTLTSPIYTNTDPINCSGTYTDPETQSGTINVTIYNSTNILTSCQWTSQANGTSWNCGLSDSTLYVKGNTINCTARYIDSESAESTNSTTLTVSNIAPEIALSYPADNATSISLQPTLNYTYTDLDSDTGNCTVYNASDNSLICNNVSISNGTTINCKWTSANSYSTTYDWYVNCTDGTDMTQSSVWNFTTEAAGATTIKLNHTDGTGAYFRCFNPPSCSTFADYSDNSDKLGVTGADWYYGFTGFNITSLSGKTIDSAIFYREAASDLTNTPFTQNLFIVNSSSDCYAVSMNYATFTSQMWNSSLYQNSSSDFTYEPDTGYTFNITDAISYAVTNSMSCVLVGWMADNYSAIGDGNYTRWNTLLSGHISYLNVSYSTDTTAPTLSTAWANASIIYDNQSVRFSVKVTDATGVDSVKFYVNCSSGVANMTSSGNAGSTYYVDVTNATTPDTGTLGSCNITSIWANDSLGNSGSTASNISTTILQGYSAFIDVTPEPILIDMNSSLSNITILTMTVTGELVNITLSYANYTHTTIKPNVTSWSNFNGTASIKLNITRTITENKSRSFILNFTATNNVGTDDKVRIDTRIKKYPCLFFDNITEVPGYIYSGSTPWSSWLASMKAGYSTNNSQYAALLYLVTGNTTYRNYSISWLNNFTRTPGDGYNDPSPGMGVVRANELHKIIKTYDWIHDELNDSEEITAREKIAELADQVFYDLNHTSTGNSPTTISPVDNHLKMYPVVAMAGYLLSDYYNNSLDHGSTPEEWIKAGGDYLWDNDTLHTRNYVAMMRYEIDNEGHEYLPSYQNYYDFYMLALFRAYELFYNSNITEDYPLAKKWVIQAVRYYLPNGYDTGYTTGGGTKFLNTRHFVRFLEDANKTELWRFYNRINADNTLPYDYEIFIPISGEYDIPFITYPNLTGTSQTDPSFYSVFNANASVQIFRESWDNTSNYLGFYTFNDTLPAARVVESFDQLHIDYYSKGDYLMGDSGEVKYMLPLYSPLNGKGHNVLMLSNNDTSNVGSVYKGGGQWDLRIPAGLTTSLINVSMDYAESEVDWDEIDKCDNTGDTLGSSITLDNPIKWRRGVLFPNREYFIVLDTVNNSNARNIYSLFHFTSLNANLTNDTQNGSVHGNLSVAGNKINWLSQAYNVEVNITSTSEIEWNTTAPATGLSTNTQLYSLPVAEVSVMKFWTRMGGQMKSAEVFHPLVRFKTINTSSAYTRITAFGTNMNLSFINISDTKLQITNGTWTDTIEVDSSTGYFNFTRTGGAENINLTRNASGVYLSTGTGAGDTTPPTISNEAINTSTGNINTSFKINWSVSDSSNIDTCKFYANSHIAGTNNVTAINATANGIGEWYYICDATDIYCPTNESGSTNITSIWCNDTAGNTNSTTVNLQFNITEAPDTTPPTVTWVIKPDLNLTSETNPYYLINITDVSDVNASSVVIYHGINCSVTGNMNKSFRYCPNNACSRQPDNLRNCNRNESNDLIDDNALKLYSGDIASFGGHQYGVQDIPVLSADGATYLTLNFTPNYHHLMSAHYPVDRTLLASETKTTQYKKIYKSHPAMIQFDTVPLATNRNKTIHFNFNIDDLSSTHPLQFWICNSSINPLTVDCDSDPNCGFIGSITDFDNKDHTDRNSSYTHVHMGVDNRSFMVNGGVGATSTAYVCLMSVEASQAKAYKLYYADDSNPADLIDFNETYYLYTANSYWNWINDSETPDAYFIETTDCYDSLMYVHACDNQSNCVNSTIQADALGTRPNKAPATPLLLQPLNGSVISGTYDITWIDGSDPEGDAFNITLIAVNSTGDETVLTSTVSNGTEIYAWDTTAYDNGEWSLIIYACDAGGCSGNATSGGNFTIDNLIGSSVEMILNNNIKSYWW